MRFLLDLRLCFAESDTIAISMNRFMLFPYLFPMNGCKPIKLHCWLVLRNTFSCPLVQLRMNLDKRRQKRCWIDFDFMVFTLVALRYMTMPNKHISSCAIDWFHACLHFTALTNYDNDVHMMVVLCIFWTLLHGDEKTKDLEKNRRNYANFKRKQPTNFADSFCDLLWSP